MVRLRWLVCTALLGACAGDTLAGSGAVNESDALASALEDDQAPSAEDGADTQATGGRADALAAQSATDARRADASDPWAAIRRIVRQAAVDNNVPGLSLTVYDAHDALVYSQEYGDFTVDRRVAVASASKLVAGLVMFALIGKDKLSLRDNTGDVLGFDAPLDTITLRHLLSFTSGLAPDAACTSRTKTTLEACVNEIGRSTPVAPPGERFDYGGTHLAVAGRMAEVRTGKSFNELFRTLLADPLGLPKEVLFYTAPLNAVGTDNPLVAGGLRISVNEYARLLSVAFHRGETADLTIGTPRLFDVAAREPYPDVEIGYSPMEALRLPFRYGLTSWLECETPAEGCSVVSSPGQYGFTPWIDREHGYYAILGMELSQAEESVASFSVDLQQRLKPLIERALSGA